MPGGEKYHGKLESFKLDNIKTKLERCAEFHQKGLRLPPLKGYEVFQKVFEVSFFLITLCNANNTKRIKRS